MSLRTAIAWILIAFALVMSASRSQSAIIQFTHDFDTILPGWHQDRYEPYRFESVVFDGDNRLLLSTDFSDANGNRGAFNGTFYNTQGMNFPAESSGSSWNVSLDLYVSSEMAAGNFLRRIGVWTSKGDFPIFDFIRNDPLDPFNASSAGITSRWRVWDPDAGTPDGWVNLAESVNIGWIHLDIVGSSSGYQYSLDSSVVYTDATAGASPQVIPGGGGVILNAYNFGTPGTADYYVDNLSQPVDASAVPEPSPWALLIIGLFAMMMVRRHQRNLDQ